MSEVDSIDKGIARVVVDCRGVLKVEEVQLTLSEEGSSKRREGKREGSEGKERERRGPLARDSAAHDGNDYSRFHNQGEIFLLGPWERIARVQQGLTPPTSDLAVGAETRFLPP